MAPKERKTKAQILAAATSGGKVKRKKWSKAKQKDKVDNKVFFTPETHEKLMTEVTKYKIVTPAIVSERLHITVSLARQAIRSLAAMNLLKPVGTHHHAQWIYTKVA